MRNITENREAYLNILREGMIKKTITFVLCCNLGGGGVNLTMTNVSKSYMFEVLISSRVKRQFHIQNRSLNLQTNGTWMF